MAHHLPENKLKEESLHSTAHIKHEHIFPSESYLILFPVKLKQ